VVKRGRVLCRGRLEEKQRCVPIYTQDEQSEGREISFKMGGLVSG